MRGPMTYSRSLYLLLNCVAALFAESRRLPTFFGILLSLCPVLFVNAAEEELDAKWTLFYAEDFSTPLDDATAPWVLDDYSNPFDTIMDDPGMWYQNDYGPAWNDALNSFSTYRKEFPVGQDGWLTASLSARDWNKDGVIEDPPTLINRQLGNDGYVAEMDVPDHTGGVIFRNTRPLPSEYRIEYKLKTIDFGGKRAGTIEYDNRINGYSTEGCKTQHPWGEGSNSRGWSGDASEPYCEWQDVREGVYGYNGFHFMTIVDYADPAPRNNHFWHYRRKVLMDSFSQHPDRVGDESGGRVCNSNTNEYYDYRDGNFNTVNMWISGLPKWAPNPGGLAGNSQWFMTTCSGGVAERRLSSAAELQPEVMPNEFYRFAIERNSTGYTLEASGNFARVGNKTLRFHRPFIVDDVPIWHYNTDPSEYDGRYNSDLVQQDVFGSMTWPDQWPAGSAYPDYFVIGDLYTNVYEGKASLTDIRLYGLQADAPPTPSPAAEDPPTPSPLVPPTVPPTGSPATTSSPMTSSPTSSSPMTSSPMSSSPMTSSPTSSSPMTSSPTSSFPTTSSPTAASPATSSSPMTSSPTSSFPTTSSPTAASPVVPVEDTESPTVTSGGGRPPFRLTIAIGLGGVWFLALTGINA